VQQQQQYHQLHFKEQRQFQIQARTLSRAPIATSGDNNVYMAWWTNKTGNDEVMFKASTDGGKTFGDKMNLSNSTNAQSQDAQIAAAGSNVYVAGGNETKHQTNQCSG
jgi:hypothetical protein